MVGSIFSLRAHILRYAIEMPLAFLHSETHVIFYLVAPHCATLVRGCSLSLFLFLFVFAAFGNSLSVFLFHRCYSLSMFLFLRVLMTSVHGLSN